MLNSDRIAAAVMDLERNLMKITEVIQKDVRARLSTNIHRLCLWKTRFVQWLIHVNRQASIATLKPTWMSLGLVIHGRYQQWMSRNRRLKCIGKRVMVKLSADAHAIPHDHWIVVMVIDEKVILDGTEGSGQHPVDARD